MTGAVRAVAVAVRDDDFPGWLEVHIRSWDGSVITLVDKSPVFGVDPGTPVPFALTVGCDVLERHGDGSASVRLHHAIEDTAGRDTFRVPTGDLS
jgi:hypothetical protein